MSQKPLENQEPENGAVNSGLSSFPVVKYVKTNKKLIITGIIIVIIIALGFIL